MFNLLKKSKLQAGQVPGALVYTGQERSEAVQIDILDFNKDSFQELNDIDPQNFDLLRSSETVTWMNVSGIHDVPLIQKLGSNFELHPLLLEDVLNIQQRPKAEEYDNHLFVTLKMLRWDENRNDVDIEHISMVLDRNYVVTFQEETGDVFEWVRNRLRTAKGRIRKGKADYLLYSLLDAVIDHYFIVLEKLGNCIEDLEEKVIDDPSQETLARINHLKRNMIHVRRAILPVRELINTIIKFESKQFQKSTLIYFRDLYDHVIQIIEIIESYKDLLGGLLDIYLSTMSNRMNEIMKVLTIFAALFIPLTFLVGIYGMNFENMPELKHENGYLYFWGVLVALSSGMLFWFRKKKWL